MPPAAADLIEVIVVSLKKEGGLTLPSFGTFTVNKTKARKALNPRTGEPVKVKAGKTVRFKASPNLKKAVEPPVPTHKAAATSQRSGGGPDHAMTGCRVQCPELVKTLLRRPCARPPVPQPCQNILPLQLGLDEPLDANARESGRGAGRRRCSSPS